jgi:hypothetical protein
MLDLIQPSREVYAFAAGGRSASGSGEERVAGRETERLKGSGQTGNRRGGLARRSHHRWR